MNRILQLGLAVLGGLALNLCAESQLTPTGIKSTEIALAENGTAAYTIAYGDDSDADAAADLAAELGKLTGGVAFQAVKTDGDDYPSPYISLGMTPMARQAGIGASFRPEESSVEIRVIDGNIYLAGAMTNDDAVSVFLEGDCGIRFFTDEITVYPSFPQDGAVRISVTDRLETSPFVDRITHSACNQPAWSRHNRIQPGTGPHGWDAFRHPKAWFCHTYSNITPPSDYSEHPELFTSEYNRPNRRHTNMQAMLCPTHPENIRRACEKIDQAMTDYPDRKYFSISEPDCGIGTNDIGGYWSFYCRCPRCQALIDKHGASVAPHLELVNTVAKYVKDRHPGKLVEFILYSFQKPPVGYPRMEDNVSAFICVPNEMFNPENWPFGTHGGYQGTVTDHPDYAKIFNAWLDIVPHRTIWEYGVDYANWFRVVPTMPFLTNNMRYYQTRGIEGILNCEVMDSMAPGQRIRTWLLAKLLWNPNLDLEALATEYISGVFGPAARPYQEYWNMVEEAGRAGVPVEKHFGRQQFIERADALFREAFELAKNAPLAISELELDYISILSMQLDDIFNAYPGNRDDFPQARYNELYDRMTEYVTRHRLTICHEMIPVENYIEERAYLVNREGIGPKASFMYHLGHGRIWNYRMAEDQPDADVVKVAAPINNDSWECQWVLPIHLLVPGRQYRFRAEVKLGQEAAPDAAVLLAGVYKDNPSNKDNVAAALADPSIHTQFKPVKAGPLSTAEFRWVDLETDTPFVAPTPGEFNETYFYVSVPSNVEMWRMLINRVEIIPDDIIL